MDYKYLTNTWLPQNLEYNENELTKGQTAVYGCEDNLYYKFANMGAILKQKNLLYITNETTK